jgi:hypothetical protein
MNIQVFLEAFGVPVSAPSRMREGHNSTLSAALVLDGERIDNVGVSDDVGATEEVERLPNHLDARQRHGARSGVGAANLLAVFEIHQRIPFRFRAHGSDPVFSSSTLRQRQPYRRSRALRIALKV